MVRLLPNRVSKMISPFELSPDQTAALDACMEALAADGEALLCGAAGTGKTFLMGYLGNQRKIMCLAPTNAAARVLRGKLPPDIPVSTIHSAAMNLSGQSHKRLIQFLEKFTEYMSIKSDIAQCNELQSRFNDLEPEQMAQCMPPELLTYLSAHWDLDGLLVEAIKRANKHNSLQFTPTNEEPHNAEILVVDEASMCTTEHRDAIRSAFGDDVPVLWVGDDAQLSPVISEEDRNRGVEPLIALLGKPTAILSTQHRQESDSMLLPCLGRIRSQQGPFRSRLGQWPGLEVMPRPRSGITKGLVKQIAEHCGSDGVAICWRNTTRRNLNRELRALRGIKEWMPQVGERLVVVMTPREPEPGAPDWAKGTIVEVCDVLGARPVGNFNELELAVFEPSDPNLIHAISVGCLPFLETYKAPRMSWAIYGDWLLDYADAITAHKAQGNEFPHVVVYEERATEQITNGKGELRSKFVGWPEHRRWLYTALSRAKESALLIVQGD